MCIDLLTNPAVIGALVGAIASATFAVVTSWYKFNKRKKGASALIRSEIFSSVELLKHFRDNYLKEEIIFERRRLEKKPLEKRQLENKQREEVNNFYKTMANFPILNNNIYWMNLISFIPDIFSENEINRIIYFYNECDGVSDDANTLSKKKNWVLVKFPNEPNEEFIIDVSLHDINEDRTMFRKKLNKLIELGESVKEIFD